MPLSVTAGEVGGQHRGVGGLGVRRVPEGGGEQGKMEKSGRKIICGAPNDPRVYVIDDDDDATV